MKGSAVFVIWSALMFNATMLFVIGVKLGEIVALLAERKKEK